MSEHIDLTDSQTAARLPPALLPDAAHQGRGQVGVQEHPGA